MTTTMAPAFVRLPGCLHAADGAKVRLHGRYLVCYWCYIDDAIREAKVRKI